MMLINIKMTKKGTRGKRCNIHYFRDRHKKGTQNDTFILINYIFYCCGLRSVKGKKMNIMKKNKKQKQLQQNFVHDHHK